MRLYISTLITGSLLIFLSSNLHTVALKSWHPSAQYTSIQLADNGQPKHRGSGRKEMLSYRDLIAASVEIWDQ